MLSHFFSMQHHLSLKAILHTILKLFIIWYSIRWKEEKICNNIYLQPVQQCTMHITIIYNNIINFQSSIPWFLTVNYFPYLSNCIQAISNTRPQSRWSLTLVWIQQPIRKSALWKPDNQKLKCFLQPRSLSLFEDLPALLGSNNLNNW